MSISSPKRPSSRKSLRPNRESGFGPGRLADFATRRPRRVLTAWGMLVVVSMGLIAALLGSGLTSEASLTNHPESAAAQDLIDARLPNQSSIDEVIVVRSERSVVSDPVFARWVRALAGEVRRGGGVAQISSYLDPGGRILVSADRHATLLPIVLAGPKDEWIEGVVSTVERANGNGGFAAHITGTHTLDRDFTELAASDLSKGELQFGLPAALVVLLLVVGTLAGAAVPMLMAIIRSSSPWGSRRSSGKCFR
jgi:putative drug exporter of the RND superfamily